jgi:uncharacterized protein
MKKITSLLIVLLLAASLTVTAFANTMFATPGITGTPIIVDFEDLLTPVEEAELEALAAEIIERYDIDVVIVTHSTPTDGQSLTDYADDFYDYNGYGIGSDHSGVLLLLDMDDREWVISTSGEAIDALTDYGQEQLMDEVLEYLGDDEYYEGFTVYLELLDEYFDAYENGEPIDQQRDLFDIVFDLVVALGIGATVGGITIAIMKSGMKTIKPQRSAQSYVNQNSFKILKQRDMFLYSRTSKTRKPSSSSGGSSTHRSSSGRRHGGSRGRF